MAEPLKNMYDGKFLETFAHIVTTAWGEFDEAAFIQRVRSGNWADLELKERIRRITEALGASLPRDYEEALAILYRVDEQCTGFPYLFFPDFVEVFGREERHFGKSMEALARFTCRSSSEFAVRPFILEHPHKMLPQLKEWAAHPNEHVRRLASEGSRPRLPWGQSLPLFKKDPQPLLPILEMLKNDESLYVRRSVANNLNDIAKDHPALVLQVAGSWLGHTAETDWIVRHACRTLVKRGNREAMALFGYAPSGECDGGGLVMEAAISVSDDILPFGGETVIRYRFRTSQDGDRSNALKLRVEYGIDFVKSGGKTSLKRFLLSDREYNTGEQGEGARTHRFADLTTRKHYPGEHAVTLWVNGVEVARTSLTLLEPS
ncbi:DNA alkylation repair protein [Paenibacillus sp. CAU 1782]